MYKYFYPGFLNKIKSPEFFRIIAITIKVLNDIRFPRNLSAVSLGITTIVAIVENHLA